MGRATKAAVGLCFFGMLSMAAKVRADTGYEAPFAPRGSGTPLRLNSAGEAAIVGTDGSVVVFKADGTPMGPMPTLPGGTYVIASGFTDPPAPNRMGLVWGYGDTGGEEHAVIWDPLAGLTDVGTLADTTISRPIGMDADGWLYAVCGNALESHPNSWSTLGQRAFVWHAGQPDVRVEIQPPVPSYDLIQLKDISPGGKVQVSSWTTGYEVSNIGYVWDRPSQSFVSIEYGGDVAEVNSSGEAVAGGGYWDPIGMEWLGVPLDTVWETSLISDSGWIAGRYYRSHYGGDSVFVMNLRDTSNGHTPGLFELQFPSEENGINARPIIVTETGQVVGVFEGYNSFGEGAQHVFFWDDKDGLSDLTPDLASVDGPAFVHSVGPAGKVVFGTSQGLFAWQRVDGIGVTTALDGLVGVEAVVPGYYWVWQPTKLSNALGQVLAQDASGNCFLATPLGITQPGTDVEVQPDADTSITFDGIVTPGETSVVAYDIDDPDAPTVPADFSLAGTGALINISTTATFSGFIELAIRYDATGMSAARESQIRLLHFVDPQWVDATDYARPGGFLDTANNIVYGKVTSLSPFAVVEALDATPPVIASVSDVHADATSTLGAIVTFSTPTASDAVDGTVAVICSQASGTLFPVGVTTVTCTSFDALHNTTTTAFDVIVRIDPRYLKGAVADTLNSLISTSDKATVKKLLKAIKDIEDGLSSDLWVDDFHLTEKGRKVFKEESEAVGHLAAIDNPASAIAQAIASLVEADRVLAATALTDATEAAPSSSHLATAASEMGLGASSTSSGEPRDAIRHYRKAWKASMKAMGLL